MRLIALAVEFSVHNFIIVFFKKILFHEKINFYLKNFNFGCFTEIRKSKTIFLNTLKGRIKKVRFFFIS